MRLPTRPEPKPANYRAALRGVADNLTLTAQSVTAWFVEDEVPWHLRSNAECDTALDGLVRAYATLSGRQIHRRISLASYPVSAWARGLDLDTPHPVDQAAWAEYLTASQQVLTSRPMAEPMCFLGVEVGKRGVVDVARGFRKTPEQVAEFEGERLDVDVAFVNDGLSEVARPATQRELEWLLHRSVGLGLPAPDAEPGAGGDPLDVTDLAGLFGSVEVDPGPATSRTALFIAAPGRNGEDPLERHVAVMSVARMEDQVIPESHKPWLARVIAGGSDVEISVRGRVIAGPDAAKRVEKRIDRILDQRRQRLRHGLVIPLGLGRVMDQAVVVQDEMAEAHRDAATRTESWIRVAVHANTAKAAMSRAVELRRHMEKQRIALQVMPAPAAVAAEFIPGEPLATTAHKRQGPVRLFVAAVPQASGSVGDRQGLRLGYTVGGTVRAPFMWDLHAAIEGQDMAGYTAVIGEKGSGKSFILGALLALSTLRGEDCTGVDPAGQLAAICKWGPIASRARHMHVLDSHMSPYGVFPRPNAAQFADHPDVTVIPQERERSRRAWELAVAAEEDAKFERRGLVLDMFRGILPAGVAAHPATEQHLMAAVRRNGGDFTSCAAGVVAELGRMRKESNDPHIAVLFDVLSELSEHPRARHWITARYEPDQAMIDAGLLMLTMEGLQLPSLATSPGMWSVSERLSLPLLNLAVHHAYSRIYRKNDRNSRKVYALDEGHYLESWPSGRAFTRKIRREDRRWNIRAPIASQDVNSAIDADGVGDALINDVIVGHCDSPEQQEKAAALLKLAPGFAPTLGRLRGDGWRDFVVRVNGRVGRVRVTLDETPDLAALLNTTPHQADTARAKVLAEQGEWFA